MAILAETGSGKTGLIHKLKIFLAATDPCLLDLPGSQSLLLMIQKHPTRAP